LGSRVAVVSEPFEQGDGLAFLNGLLDLYDVGICRGGMGRDSEASLRKMVNSNWRILCLFSMVEFEGPFMGKKSGLVSWA
jgi:hypothetical protein